MSVQGGIWDFNGQPADRDFITRISQSLAEYGPHGNESYFNGSIGMLYRPFHTTLESRAERQPYISQLGRVITWDGRLDNRDQLIDDLCSALQNDRTDVAIVASAFDRWGTDCFAKLIGEWAVVVWNPRARELILARDYIGVRQLFYCVSPRRVIWCSHLSPLALCGDQFTLSNEYIAGYLAEDPEAHLTPYREILAVPPGKLARIGSDKAIISTYWSLNPGVKNRYKTDAEYEEAYRHVFRQAVRRRLRTDSSVLAELSGGLDSSSIVCMTDDILANETFETQKVDTFSYYDSGEPDEDDLSHFRRVEEERRRTGFHVDLCASGDSLVLRNPSFVAAPGFGTRNEVKQALLRVLKDHKYRVLLSGFGGDEINGQTLDPRVVMADLLLQMRLVELAKQLTTWSLLIRKRPWIQLFLQTAVQALPAFLRATLSSQGEVEPWINDTFARKQKMSIRQVQVASRGCLLPSHRDAAQTVSTLSRRISCAEPSPIERRYPFLDQTLVEFLTTIPPDQLLRPGERRSLMRRALQNIVPAEILARRTKSVAGRSSCIALMKHWHEVESAFVSPLTSHLGFVDKDSILEALLSLKNGKVPIYVVRLLKALSLEFWLRDVQARNVISILPSFKIAGTPSQNPLRITGACSKLTQDVMGSKFC
jgi:asparagine synthase (glutamine-hydrolysing)